MEQMQVEQIAIQQMDSGERLLWSGAPSPAAAAMTALPASLFGIPFAAFACFWIWGAWSATSRGISHGPWALFPLFGVPFVLVGVGIVAMPLWAYLGAQKTVYAVTDRRALIIGAGPMKGVQSFTRADIGDVSRVESANGSGSVFFATRLVTTRSGIANGGRIGFVGIPDVRQVEQLIRDNLHQQAA